MTTTVIVGGVAGGMSTATRLRRRDENMEIIVFEASPHVSYANCGLPYYVGSIIPERESLLLQTPESLSSRFNIDVHVNHRVTAIDPENQIVTVQTPTGQITQKYDFLVLSPGARPITPPIPGIERATMLRTVEDADAIVEKLTANTKTAAIIGGGFIGLELAENFRNRGMNVTVIERAPHILTPFDQEMAGIVTQRLRENGVTVLTNTEVTAIGDVTITLSTGEELSADLVIAAIGVAPDSSLAKAAGIELGDRGGIKVNDQLQTNISNIFALGDAAEKRDSIDGSDQLIPLAQTANRNGRLVADIITGRNVSRTSTQATAIVGVFGIAAATTGWNERRARSAGRNVRVVHVHPGDHAGYYPGATPIHIKLIIDADTDAILGAQAVGDAGVDKRIDVIATAMHAGLTATDLADLELAYAPQFGSAKDPINIAGMVADNRKNDERSIQWHEIEQIAGVQLIDVRTAAEFAAGSIPGAINIPVDELRANIAHIEDEVIVFCQVGLRGHIATSLLSGHGITVSNLDGGYVTWSHSRLV
ncbi:NAD(FAD)-dependent dehydrogenase [Corynebacterium mustelae]|uniref:NAD(FAD)-dependent dehydrogenase n=1 Tax=Corynebacterium mustelae TaxID=571915 RepID=A0A0G3H1Z2_9CORY|nr:FAD-dependent oxidoreductase [Corynebacterium mustelae]AKK05838.1 NAD(FAD)-dependent dehydrogenase [Corynebacterium mustelae]